MNALISRHEKTRSGYDVPRHFQTGWIFYTSSDGSIADEMIMRRDWTKIQVMERALYKQIKNLKQYESMEK